MRGETMTVLPAKVAGVGTVLAVTPPSKGMIANPATLVAADVAGCDEGKEELQPRLALTLPLEEGAGARYRLFVGPKEYHILRAEGHDLGAVINFGPQDHQGIDDVYLTAVKQGKLQLLFYK